MDGDDAAGAADGAELLAPPQPTSHPAASGASAATSSIDAAAASLGPRVRASTSCASFPSSTKGMIDTASPSKMVHSAVESTNVLKSGRSPGTSTDTR